MIMQSKRSGDDRGRKRHEAHLVVTNLTLLRFKDVIVDGTNAAKVMLVERGMIVL